MQPGQFTKFYARLFRVNNFSTVVSLLIGWFRAHAVSFADTLKHLNASLLCISSKLWYRWFQGNVVYIIACYYVRTTAHTADRQTELCVWWSIITEVR